MNRTCGFLILFWLCVTTGCSPQNQLGRKAVSGEISVSKKPLQRGSILFAPQQSGVSSGAEIQDGRFEIPAHQGLTPGTYTVRIYSTDEEAEAVEPVLPGPGVKVQPEKIPAKYNMNSDLELVVTETDAEVVFDLEIQP